VQIHHLMDASGRLVVGKHGNSSCLLVRCCTGTCLFSSDAHNDSRQELTEISLDSHDKSKLEESSIEGKEPPAALSITVSPIFSAS
jgi:hypothetical protein